MELIGIDKMELTPCMVQTKYNYKYNCSNPRSLSIMYEQSNGRLVRTLCCKPPCQSGRFGINIDYLCMWDVSLGNCPMAICHNVSLIHFGSFTNQELTSYIYFCLSRTVMNYSYSHETFWFVGFLHMSASLMIVIYLLFYLSGSVSVTFNSSLKCTF